MGAVRYTHSASEGQKEIHFLLSKIHLQRDPLTVLQFYIKIGSLHDPLSEYDAKIGKRIRTLQTHQKQKPPIRSEPYYKNYPPHAQI